MAFNSGYLSITTSATAVNTDANDSASAAGGTVIVKVPAGGQTVYLGGAAVTADTTAGTGGFQIAAGESLSVHYGPGEILYGIVAATTQSVHVLRQGV